MRKIFYIISSYIIVLRVKWFYGIVIVGSGINMLL